MAAAAADPKKQSAADAKTIGVGDKFPTGLLFEGNPDNKINTDELLAKKRVVLFAVPGAFTPTCSNTHLPSYIKEHGTLKKKGVDEIVCLSVNDPFVMEAWGKHAGSKDKVRMLADTNAAITKALGLTLETDKLGFIRSRRYSMLIEDRVVKQLNIEAAPGSATCSMASEMVEKL